MLRILYVIVLLFFTSLVYGQPIFSGIFPIEMSVRTRIFHAVDLNGDGRDELLVSGNGQVNILEYNNSFTTAANLGYSHFGGKSPQYPDLRSVLTIGDIDNDNRNEALIFGLNSMQVIDWTDNEYSFTVHHLDKSADQAIIGDIDGDGKNEIVTLNYDRALEYENYRFTMSILGTKADGWEESWCDDGSLELDCNGIQPPPRLCSIGKISEDGPVYLVMTNQQSDMSATWFKFYIWDGEILNLEFVKRFEKPNKEERPFLMGKFNFVMKDGSYCVESKEFAYRDGIPMGQIVISFPDGEINDNWQVVERSPGIYGRNITYRELILNPDSRGEGKLKVTYSSKSYEFDR